MSNRPGTRHVILIVFGLVITTGVVLFLTLAGREVWHYLRNREALRELISSWGTWAWLGVILLQAIQIVFAPLPGSLLSFAGGYVLGVWPAIVWLMLGVLLGATIDFLLARLLGRRLLRYLIPADKLTRLDSMIIHRGAFYIFLLLLIPNPLGDWIYYLAGLTPLPLPVFLVFVLVARLPSNLIEAILGSSAARFNWLGWTALAAAILALSLLYYFNQRRIEAIIERLATRKRREPAQPS
ncbi:MAG: VTT domain-containing protein [candidate division WOR-3 bacterium]